MDPNDVISIEGLQDRLKNLVNKFQARTAEEWELKERLTTANRSLRQIDTGKLRQARLEMEEGGRYYANDNIQEG